MRTKINKYLIILTCFFLLSTIVFLLLFYYGYLRFNYVNLVRFPIQGLDVSHHQGKIEWNKLDISKFKFVFIKSTEGGNLVDPKFQFNWINAHNNGFFVGAYHFFTFKKSGMEQAHNFINTVPNNIKSLPPVVDLEFMGNSKIKLSKSKLFNELSNFINIVEKQYHKKPILYSTYEFYEYYLIGHFNNYPIWIRDIFKKPKLIDNRNWTFWQYANRARIPWIENYVDLNVFNGNEDEFINFINN